MIFVDGLDELIADLAEAAATIGKRSDEAVGESAEKVRAEAAANAPTLTGALRASIAADRLAEAVWEVGPTVDYGLFVEYGTSKDAPQPYLGPAADRSDLEQRIAEVGGDV